MCEECKDCLFWLNSSVRVSTAPMQGQPSSLLGIIGAVGIRGDEECKVTRRDLMFDEACNKVGHERVQIDKKCM